MWSQTAFLLLVLEGAVGSGIPTIPIPTETITQGTRGKLRARATTSAPSVSPVNTALCGWVGGNPGHPWTCAINGTCVVATDPATNAIGCCSGGRCGTFRTACIPATAQCDSACSANRAYLKCNNDNPLCVTFTYSGNYTELRCTTSVPATKYQQIAFTWNGFPTALPLPREVARNMSDCDSTSRCIPDIAIQTQTPNPSSTSESGITTGAGITTGTESASTATTSSDSGSSSHTGAIVGGAVGGVGAVAIIGGLLYFYYRRKRRTSQTQQQPMYSGPTEPTIGKTKDAIVMQRGSDYTPSEVGDGGTEDGSGYYAPGVVKAELPTQDLQKRRVPAEEQRYEVDGTEREGTPLMELEANERP